MKEKKDFLYQVFGLTIVSQNTPPYTAHQTGIAPEQTVESVGIARNNA
jgi:hypothetical protein